MLGRTLFTMGSVHVNLLTALVTLLDSSERVHKPKGPINGGREEGVRRPI